jgi:hypothetical protein
MNVNLVLPREQQTYIHGTSMARGLAGLAGFAGWAGGAGGLPLLCARANL